MDRNLGNQAMAIANNFSRIQNNIDARADSALRTQYAIKENQKQDLTKIWADELVKNPNAKMPDDLPHGVKFASKVLAMKYNTDFTSLDRQRFAKEAETYRQDLDTSLASLSSGAGREFYKVPVLRAMSRIRDGKSDYVDLGNGKWEYTNNSTGKREQVDEPNAEWLQNYILAHRDLKPYLAAKVKETNWERDYNKNVFLKGGIDYIGNDGVTRGTIYKRCAKPNGGFYDLYVVTDSNGIERELKTPEDIQWFHKNLRNADNEKGRAEINKADREMNEPVISKTMMVDGKQMSKKEAMDQISMLSRQVLPGDESALAGIEKSLAEMRAGIKYDPKEQSVGNKNSAYAKAKKIVEDKGVGWEAADKLIKLIDSFAGTAKKNDAGGWAGKAKAIERAKKVTSAQNSMGGIQ